MDKRADMVAEKAVNIQMSEQYCMSLDKVSAQKLRVVDRSSLLFLYIASKARCPVPTRPTCTAKGLADALLAVLKDTGSVHEDVVRCDSGLCAALDGLEVLYVSELPYYVHLHAFAREIQSPLLPALPVALNSGNAKSAAEILTQSIQNLDNVVTSAKTAQGQFLRRIKDSDSRDIRPITEEFKCIVKYVAASVAAAGTEKDRRGRKEEYLLEEMTFRQCRRRFTKYIKVAGSTKQTSPFMVWCGGTLVEPLFRRKVYHILDETRLLRQYALKQ